MYNDDLVAAAAVQQMQQDLQVLQFQYNVGSLHQVQEIT
jgi:hypothetical protein